MVTSLCSTALFLEYEVALSREQIRKATGRNLKDVALVVSMLAAVCGVDIPFWTRPMLSDVAYEMMLESRIERTGRGHRDA